MTIAVDMGRKATKTNKQKPEFQGDIYKFWGTYQTFKFLPVRLNVSYPEISVNFLFKFELDVARFGLRRGVDDSEVVSSIALVLNSPANFYIKITFFSGLLL